MATIASMVPRRMTHLIDDSPDPAHKTNRTQREYLMKRAEDHRTLAQRTTESSSRAIHLRLERLYQDQADSIAIVLSD